MAIAWGLVCAYHLGGSVGYNFGGVHGAGWSIIAALLRLAGYTPAGLYSFGDLTHLLKLCKSVVDIRRFYKSSGFRYLWECMFCKTRSSGV